MSLSSEQDVLHPYLLRDVLEDAKKQMEVLLQKYRGDGFDDMYYKGYISGLQFSKEKVDAMWEEFKGMLWSESIDERDYQKAKESHEMQV